MINVAGFLTRAAIFLLAVPWATKGILGWLGIALLLSGVFALNTWIRTQALEHSGLNIAAKNVLTVFYTSLFYWWALMAVALTSPTTLPVIGGFNILLVALPAIAIDYALRHFKRNR